MVPLQSRSLRLIAAIATLAVMAFAPQSCFARLSCAGRGSVRAQDSLGTDYSWQVIYRVYRAYERCDENLYFSQSYSIAILKTLARKWGTLPELGKIVASDSAFLNFVLLHIDATAEDGVVKQILANTSKNCPAGCDDLCERFRARAARAAAQMERLRQEEK